MTTGRHHSRGAILAASMAMTLAFMLGMTAVQAAGRDRTPPSTPTDLHLTSNTSWSVSLAWSPSTDNSGSFTHRVHHSWGHEASVPKTQTSFTWTSNLEARQTYSFHVHAVDAAGNKSKNSNTVTVTLPRDTTPPTTPVLSVTDVGLTSVSLAWISQDDGPYFYFWIFQDGNLASSGNSGSSVTIPLLDPESTYTSRCRPWTSRATGRRSAIPLR